MIKCYITDISDTVFYGTVKSLHFCMLTFYASVNNRLQINTPFTNLKSLSHFGLLTQLFAAAALIDAVPLFAVSLRW